jgi:hypothetical protein
MILDVVVDTPAYQLEKLKTVNPPDNLLLV